MKLTQRPDMSHIHRNFHRLHGREPLLIRLSRRHIRSSRLPKFLKLRKSQLIIQYQYRFARAADLILIADLWQFKEGIVKGIHIELSIADLHLYAND